MNVEEIERQYLDWMRTNGNDPVDLELSLVQLAAVIAAVQLALRHPRFPKSTRACLEQTLASVFAQLRDTCPLGVAAWELGNERRFDREPS